MPTVEQTISAAESLLRDAWGRVCLDRHGEVLSEHGWPTVLRVSASGNTPASSVIVKTYRSWAPYDPADPTSPASGLFAEWSALEVLNDLLPDEGGLPKLYAGDRDRGVVVMQDVGCGPSLEQVLLGSDERLAMTALAGVSRVLGRVHNVSAHQRDRYNTSRASLGPEPDHVAWAEGMWSRAERALHELGVSPSPSVTDTLTSIGAKVTTPLALCHTEPADGNVVVVNGHAVLLDFEGSRWGDPAVDAAFPRTAFGHLPTAGRLPHAIVLDLERTYTAELGDTRASVKDELRQAAVWIALVTLGCYYRTSHDDSLARFGGRPMRERLGSQWSRVAADYEGHDLGEMATNVTKAMSRAWGADRVPELPIYPAFASSGERSTSSA